MLMPANTAKKLSTKLLILYKIKIAVFPSRNSITFSYANAEKVVNPPQKPVIRKRRHSVETEVYLTDEV